MSRIFLSHSSANNAEAVVVYDWLEQQGWKDEVFLDLDPKRGIAAGERWERRLNEGPTAVDEGNLHKHVLVADFGERIVVMLL